MMPRQESGRNNKSRRKMPRRESGRLANPTPLFRMPRIESGRLPQNMTSDLLTLVKPKGRELRELHGVFTETPHEITPGPFGTLSAKFTDGKGSRKGSMAAFPLPVVSGLPNGTSTSYFETQILSIGDGGMAAIGLKIPTDCQLHNQLPGWQSGTFGLHSDDGGVYFSGGEPIDNVKAFVAGTVVGIGVCSLSENDIDSSLVFVAINGTLCWKRKLAMPHSAGLMQGLIGCDCNNTQFVVNKGQMPFVFKNLKTVSTM